MRNAREQQLKEMYEGKVMHLKIGSVMPLFGRPGVKVEATIIETERDIEFNIED